MQLTKIEIVKEVIILAGGFGTRLRSVVNDKPKCLAVINERPFLSYLIDSLLKYNYDRFIFSLGYMSDDVIEFIKSSYPELDSVFSIEEAPLLTGGAIRLALEFVESDSVLILNADTFFGLDLSLFFEYHMSESSDMTIALKPMFKFDRYGAVIFDNKNVVVAFEEKAFKEFGHINCGYVYLKKEVLSEYPLNVPFSFESDFIKINLKRLRIIAFIDDSYFIDIGIPEDYFKANLEYHQLS